MHLTIESVSALRAQLWDAGFRPVPIVNSDAPGPSPGKRPLGNDWRQDALRDPPFCVRSPAVPFALNTGLLCDGLRPIDIDIDDPAIANRIRAMAVDRFGEAPIRMRRNSPRCTILYRAAVGLPTKIAITGATHTQTNALKVEILGAGQQFVAMGRHDSGADLEWFPEAPGEITAESLPSVTEEDILAFLVAVAPLIGAEPPGRVNGHDHYSASDPQADPLRVAAAVANIPNAGPADWEAWNKIGMAIWAATGGSAIGGELFNEWSKRHLAYDAAETEARWLHYRRSPPTSIGAGTLFHLGRGTAPMLENTPDPPVEFDDPNYWDAVEADAPAVSLADLIRPDDAEKPTEPGRVFDPWNTLQPVPFPLEAIPTALRTFVLNRAAAIGADPGAIAWSALCACSSAIHGETKLHMKRHDPWTVAPALWVALIGAPSTKKSPIIDLAWRPLVRIQATELAAHQRAHDQWKQLPKKERDQTPEPFPRRRLVSNDGTMEALQDILSRQTRGIGVVRDELAGWIGSMDKYAPGKGSAADRAFWLQSFNGGSHVVDRVMRGTLSIENLLTAICGGIQPDRLAQFKDLTDDGLFQRFIPYIVAPGSIGGDEPLDVSVDDYNVLVNSLLAEKPARLALSDAAHKTREAIQERLHALEQAEVLGGRFTGFVGKLVGIWGRLCLVLHMLQDSSTSIVSGDTASAARALLFRSIIPNAARVYTAMGGAGGEMEATQSIAGYILTKRLDRVLMSDLTRNVRVCRGRSIADVQKLVSPLEAGGWLQPEREFNATSWRVAEQVHVFFADRARKEMTRRTLVRSLITGADDD